MKKIQLGGHRYKNKPVRGYALVDDINYKLLSQWMWSLSTRGYAVRRLRNGKAILMHRFILKAKKGENCDHKDGNKLNNQIINLRIVTQAQNTRNRVMSSKNISGFKGVSIDRDNKNKYIAGITINYKRIHLGTFLTVKQAALAYNNAAIKYFGEFAKLNLIK